ncbi:3'-5' RNA helicase YTHDC2-like [Penaeus japonicus]|uniref:3'-5' RNA helicase YTHDC2-like n=1 Tax=Penaeus japonicus TaxID=27405 RepID=UPI001C70B87B|nr:3'-5' RNA helicase YTHDC2-like [Penaeus japonicus]XP_042863705.1 3'-5' RNA helicase YTHDC2-like [Penaeus japonicus]
MGRKRPNWRFNEAHVSEELKITVALALKKLMQNDDQKELEFPSSLTSEERKYIHFVAQQMGLKSKSRGKGSSRYLTVYKKEGSTIMSSEAVVALADSTRSTILGLLQRCPVTNKERQDLLPATERDRLMNPELRDLSVLRSLGRLTPGPPQIPPPPSLSDLTADARKLPIWNMKDQLLAAIHHNQVILVCGETGSGKTTQVPQMLLQEASSLGKPCRIFCTQPRRISALTTAERVAAERGEKVGYTVGYQIRLESKLSPKTLLTFCTNGVLLRTLMGGDSSLASVTHILVDEVHERDRFTDFLLLVLRDCLHKFRHLKLILMSAALDVNLYAKYFNNCPVIDVPGRCYPVKEYFLEDVLKYTSYQTPEMLKAYKELEQRQSGQKTAAAWTQQMSQQTLSLGSSTPASEPRSSITNSEFGKGSGAELDNTLKEEMDKCIQEAFLTGADEAFSQMMYLIMSENVSPDYQHSETWATALMVASGRGRVDIVEQLLALGSSLTLRAANDWTAADWAQSTGQQETLDLLHAYSACEGVDLLTISGKGMQGSSTSSNHGNVIRGPSTVVPLTELLPEEKRMLDAYHHSVSEEVADVDLVYALCYKIHTSQPPGAILIFLPGYDDIVNLRDRIIAEEKQYLIGGKYCLFCLHSSMQSSDQKRVFKASPPGVRKIILSTNIAETSVTINDVVYVIDAGKMKEVSFDSNLGVSCLRCVWISQASSQQRRGRAGRCQPGICYHLFSRSRYNSMQQFQTPEILRTPLQELCLHTKLLAPANMPIADFLARAPEAPAFMVIRNAVQLLKSMDALDGWEDVTELGHHLLDLPLPPRLAKMVITATVLKCLDPVLTIAACLSYKDPFILPKHPNEKRSATAVRRKFTSGTYSDHMVLLKAFQAWQKACSEGWERGWCERNFVSGANMEMIHGMRSQVLAQLRGAGFVRARGPGDIRDVNSNSDNWAMVKAALVSGMYPNLIRVDREQCQLRTQKESKVRLHPTSSLLDMAGNNSEPLSAAHRALVSALSSDWLVYDEMVRIGVVAHVKTVTLVSPLTVLLLAGPMRLPLDALSEPSSRGSGDCSSDSESEDRPMGLSCLVRIDNWIQFLGDPQAAHLALQLRHKLHALILRRLRAPNKPLTQADEDVVRVVATALSQEEQVLSLVQPSGVGQRPRPLYPHSHPHEGGWSGGTSEDSQSSRSSSRRTSDTATPTLTPTTSPAGQLHPSVSLKFPGNSSSLSKSLPPGTISVSSSATSSISSSSVNAFPTSPLLLTSSASSMSFSTSGSSTLTAPPTSGTKPNSNLSSNNATKTSTTSPNSPHGGSSVALNMANQTANGNSNRSSTATTSCAIARPSFSPNVGVGGMSKPSTKDPRGCLSSSIAEGGSNGGKPRFFIIKASSYKQLEASHHTGLWAFTHNTEKKIMQAFQNGPVILVFTLHRGNQFNGYARFIGEKSEEKCPDITSAGPTLGPLYKIDWVKKWNVGFHQTRRLYNPYTDNMQVHMSRDGQEVEASVGDQLIKLWEKSGGSNTGGGGGYKGPNSYMVGSGGPPIMHDPQGPPPPPRHPLHPPHLGPVHSPFHHHFGRNYGNGYGYGGGSGSGGGGGCSGGGGYRGGYRYGGYRR